MPSQPLRTFVMSDDRGRVFELPHSASLQKALAV